MCHWISQLKSPQVLSHLLLVVAIFPCRTHVLLKARHLSVLTSSKPNCWSFCFKHAEDTALKPSTCLSKPLNTEASFGVISRGMTSLGSTDFRDKVQILCRECSFGHTQRLLRHWHLEGLKHCSHGLLPVLLVVIGPKHHAKHRPSIWSFQLALVQLIMKTACWSRLALRRFYDHLLGGRRIFKRISSRIRICITNPHMSRKNICKKGTKHQKCGSVSRGSPDIRYKVVLHSQQSWFHS